MTSFSRFQERNRKRTVAQNKLNTSFVFKSYPSTTISDNNGNNIQAAVVNKQEKDFAYIFTSVADELPIGSVWSTKGLNFLITEEIISIKDVDWKKYHSLLCNVQVEGAWGYFKGPEKSFLEVNLEQQVLWESPQKPVLVLPENVVGFRDKIVIKGRAWLIQEYDAISTPGLVYYSLKPTTIGKVTIAENMDKETYVEKFEEPEVVIVEQPVAALSEDLVIQVSPNIPITISTEDGYFKTNNKNLKVSKRTKSEVTFTIPFGISEVAVEIKERGDIVEQTYRVV